jgi:hypothetical protein
VCADIRSERGFLARTRRALVCAQHIEGFALMTAADTEDFLADYPDRHALAKRWGISWHTVYRYELEAASIMPKKMELEEVRRSTRRAEDMTDDGLPPPFFLS